MTNAMTNATGQLIEVSSKNFSKKQTQRGQGMTEYIIIVALIAVAAIAVYQFFGQVVRSQTAAIAHEVAGTDGMLSSNVAGAAAGLADQQRTKKGLNDYAVGATTAGAP
jgi:type IV pilus assembly protein PilA